ncbi:phosphatase domain-containing putative toxin [Paracidovorax konjaci]|uniref:Inositol hexakisphosphate n=1 Tax=Paracidovorax konjaci TaxID=32040 RepID=A0A1I1XMV0_9BURK|nr:tyrosine-protein phosphatase [Paracidovorax konjaci]SFE08636.1 Inositol hexakisphosphate [Paracidovorax konjaci]
MPHIVFHRGLLKSCLPPKEKDISPPAEEQPRTSSKCLDASRFIGIPTLRRGAAPAKQSVPDASPPDAPPDASNHSGPIGRHRTVLRFREPERESDAVLVYDTPPLQPPEAMAFFRHTGQTQHLPPSINTQGLDTLLLAGSERISSVDQVKEIRRHFGDVPLVVVDLRQESHAVAQKHPLTWRGAMDWANVGLKTDAVLELEAQQIEALRLQRSATALHADQVKGKTADPAAKRLDTAEVRSEQEIVEAAGAAYSRIAVSDHVRPAREDVDRFIALVRSLPEGTALHVHCNGGRGRTTTFMALYDMLQNARVVDAASIIARQSSLGYDYNLADTGAVKESKRAFHADRLDFLQEFHAYARENPRGQPLSWSEWRGSDA